MLKFVATNKEIKVEGVTVLNVQGTVDMGTAMDQAFFTEGEIYVFHPSIEKAEEKADHLNFELESELDDIIVAAMEDKKYINKLLDEGMADDVVAHVQAEAKRRNEETNQNDVAVTTEEEIVMESKHMEMVMKGFGLTVGQTMILQGEKAVIKGFKATDEGAHVVLEVSGKVTSVHANIVLDLVKEMEEMEMTKKEVVQQQKSEKVEKTMTNEQRIAQSQAAKAFLASQQKKVEGKKEEGKNNKEEKSMKPKRQLNVGATQNQNTQKEEKEMNKEKEVRRGAGRAMAGGNRPTRQLAVGAVQQNRRQVAGMTAEQADAIFDKKENKTVEGQFSGMPWYLNTERYENVMGAEILEVRKNEALGITDLQLFAPSDVVGDRAGDEIAYVEVTIGGNIVIPFKIKWNTNTESASPITSTNIKWFESKAGKLYPEYVFYRKNEKVAQVKCACGKWNDIKEANKAQQCECGKKVGLSSKVVGGEDVSASYVAQRLAFGFKMDRSTLAQVMAFAHHKLAPLFATQN